MGLILGLSSEWCIYTPRQNKKLEQENAHPLKSSMKQVWIKRPKHAVFLFLNLWGRGWGQSKFSVYCAHDCSLQVSEKPNLQMLFVLQEHACDLSYMYGKNWVTWLKTRTAKRLVKAVWFQQYSFQSFLFQNIRSNHIQRYKEQNWTVKSSTQLRE